MTTQLGSSLDVKQTWSAVTAVELSYNHATGMVSAKAASDLAGGTTHTLSSIALGFTPLFNKVKIEVLDDGAATPYFDNLSITAASAGLSLFIVGSTL